MLYEQIQWGAYPVGVRNCSRSTACRWSFPFGGHWMLAVEFTSQVREEAGVSPRLLHGVTRNPGAADHRIARTRVDGRRDAGAFPVVAPAQAPWTTSKCSLDAGPKPATPCRLKECSDAGVSSVARRRMVQRS